MMFKYLLYFLRSNQVFRRTSENYIRQAVNMAFSQSHIFLCIRGKYSRISSVTSGEIKRRAHQHPKSIENLKNAGR